MKKYRFIPVFAVLTICLLSACAGEKTDANGFADVVEIKADSIAVHEILQPRRYTVSGDKMLLLTDKGDSLMLCIPPAGSGISVQGITCRERPGGNTVRLSGNSEPL